MIHKDYPTPPCKQAKNQAIRAFGLLGLMVTLVIALPAQSARNTRGEFTLAVTGDSLIITPAEVRKNNPKFMAIVDEVRKGDAAFTNLEVTFPSHDAYPSGAPRGDNMAASPSMLKELKWIGLNLFQTSNNHATDWGLQGLTDTLKVLRSEPGIAFAGTGENLGEARMPGYLTTPHGRVALVSCASTAAIDSYAGEARSDMRGRPGVSPLRWETRYRVTTSEFETLRKVNDDLKLEGAVKVSGSSPTLTIPLPVGMIYQTPTIFEESESPGVETTPDPTDVAALSRQVREARYFADYVVASSHTHERVPGEDKAESFTPPEFLAKYAHAMIDAGADVFAGTGAHVTRGIEIYKGKPIFYSLANFIAENWIAGPQSQTMYERYGLGPEALSSEAHNARSDHGKRDEVAWPYYWESVVALVRFVDGKPAQVILTPYTLGFGRPVADLGYPEKSDIPTATAFLQHLRKISEPFGTKIEINNGVGTHNQHFGLNKTDVNISHGVPGM
jgi:poly-gamma-glutamate capsule biosynthesis protein CapA/YwtB (metallophosphatase superfamily)